jgi:molecular chaperone HtpG
MSKKESYNFQTEVKQLLNLVIHSLYSNKEIFLRELISNSSDALEKLRFLALKDGNIYNKDTDLSIKVSIDKKEKTITISDNGIGMSRKEIIENLGTIANSGTKKFFDSLTGDHSKDTQLIGQFGVGFYSAYIVADKVTVQSLKAGLNSEHGVRWSSEADGNFEVEDIVKNNRGTDVILRLKSEHENLLEPWKLKEIIVKYSNHISMPIKMLKSEFDDKGKEKITDTWEIVNKAQALWTRSKSDVSDNEYKEFYKNISHDFNNPLLWVHNKVEGKIEYTSLLFLPEKAPFDLWDRDRKSGLQLYVKRTFIMENDQILPSYLRFIKGIIDSNDLPLNISREILQHNKVIEAIRKATIKKVLDLLNKMSKNQAEKFNIFWKAFGQVLKEGPAEDQNNKEKIAELFRFSSTHEDSSTQNISLNDYISRMKPEQKYIYYITAESFNAAKNNPQLEIFRKKEIEVLFLFERIDEWMTSHLPEYHGKKLKSISKGELDLGKLNNEKDDKIQKDTKTVYESILKQMKSVLKDKVEDIRVSQRLTKSPSCIVVNDYGMSMHLQKMMSDAGKAPTGVNSSKPILELNPNHKLVINLKEEQDDSKFSDLSNILYQQAMLIEGAQIDDPAGFVHLINNYIS